jgi:hypothetical protein
MSPFAFYRVPLFHRRSFQKSPFEFCGVPLFSLEVFSNETLCVLWGASFFIGGLVTEPMNERSYSTPLFMALMFCVERLLNFQLTFVSCFNYVLMGFLGNEALLMLQGT